MMESDWILCPLCGSKTRDKIRADTEMKNFPVFCPKCKEETLAACSESMNNQKLRRPVLY